MKIILEVLVFFGISAIFGWENYLLILLLAFVAINIFTKRRK